MEKLPIKAEEVPHKDQVCRIVKEFVSKQEKDSVFKGGITMMSRVSGSRTFVANRYASTELYEQIDLKTNVLFIMKNWQMARDAEISVIEGLMKLNRCANSSRDHVGGVHSASNEEIAVYVTKLKEDFFTCPSEKCTTRLQAKPMAEHIKKHEFYVRANALQEALLARAFAPLDLLLQPTKVISSTIYHMNFYQYRFYSPL